MKKIYITTNYEKAKTLVNDNDEILKKVSSQLSNFPCILNFGEDFQVIICNDNYNDWDGIDAENDYILYHLSSAEEVKKNIKKTFSHHQGDSHTPKHLYDKVYRIIFGDNQSDIPNRILKELGFTEEQLSIKDNLNAKLNILHKCLSPETISTIEDSETSKLTAEEKNAFKAFTTFKIDNKIKDPFDKKYISELVKLRTEFLPK